MSARDLEAARQRLAAAEAYLRQISEKVKAEERKADTRKKIILGGALLALQRDDPQAFNQVLLHLVKHLGQRDKKWLQDVGFQLPES
uniref:Mobilization protein n=1 Tax=uncultured prokaryote TaxID=198431 RepID=A0A0H5Q4V9_9ZZZZ|nr:hypothetical protein [uncultured prokaryote]